MIVALLPIIEWNSTAQLAASGRQLGTKIYRLGLIGRIRAFVGFV